MAGSLDRYIAAVAAAACLFTATVVLSAGVGRLELIPVAILALGVAIAERVELGFRFERTAALFGLVEAAVICGLLLLPTGTAVIGIAVGMLIAQVSRRFGLRRTVFNLANGWLGTSGAAVVLLLTPSNPPLVAGRSVAAALLAMLAYTAINAVAMYGLMGRVAGEEARHNLREQIPLTVATTLGTTTVGIVLAALIDLHAALAPLLLGPGAAVYLAARGATRNAELLATVRTDRDRLNRVIDGASDGILLLDRDAVVQVWNPAMEQLTGLAEGEVAGQRIADVLTDDRREGPEPVRGRWLMDDASRKLPRRDQHAELRNRDGTVRAVQESHALVYDDRGRCTGDVVVVRDVSRQQELERLRSDFVARVSHELRTPLTPIRGFAGVLLKRGDDLTAEQRTDALQRIVERADHLGELVEDLLLVTQVDRGELTGLVTVRPEDVGDVTARAIGRAREREPGRRFDFSATPGLGRAMADPERLGQILDAVLDNACRYSPPGAPVEVELERVGDEVCVRVRDHGPGIPREQRQAVFERFHRLEDPMTMRTGGVGLGLFLASRLAEAMQGELELEETPPGRGASFRLRLPAAAPAEDVRT